MDRLALHDMYRLYFMASLYIVRADYKLFGMAKSRRKHSSSRKESLLVEIKQLLNKQAVIAIVTLQITETIGLQFFLIFENVGSLLPVYLQLFENNLDNFIIKVFPLGSLVYIRLPEERIDILRCPKHNQS